MIQDYLAGIVFISLQFYNSHRMYSKWLIGEDRSVGMGCVNQRETCTDRLVYFINAVAYLVMSEDKRRARMGRDRVPERTLFCWSP